MSGATDETKTEEKAVWSAHVLTLFPEMFPGPVGQSLAGRGLKEGAWNLEVTHIRDHAVGKHLNVDDSPFGGGAGMVMRPDVLGSAIEKAQAVSGKDKKLIYFSPRGRVMDQKLVRELAEGPGVILICGRFEGVDQRVLDEHDVEEVSLGDFILSGGEVPALAMLDAVVRLLPGVTGNVASLEDESFETGLLEYPHYTRPAVWKDREVPEVLLSGHHEKIKDWRQRQSEELTKQRRADLWERWSAENLK
ncbi:tRNA (guanosine(37)-N1)-methyltransferase TrmD [Sneathiella sp. P13V-1]|uniref:tRNA (guanosine(37)-N1)-methyltransferase TrmD n=1 Tax=Sneathiella sp. P13V-1 TaxID=2697366 RepID=UPI00187B1C00|nr:tRNA (guanosine(37)-N1)-methyltransferase TrmD [Sneathiella sp. P13V-1]MBE7636305.1 tRNA (guanosine(37)-N1)-methyltransferase TrmD [Sneathiella sp. P13V-1]